MISSAGRSGGRRAQQPQAFTMAVAMHMTPTKPTRWPRIAGSPQIASLVILCVVMVAFAVGNENFLSPLNVSNMLAFLPELGIIALGMTLLLTAGEFDLSIGAVFALASVVVMLLVQNAGWGLGFALLAGLMICIAIGWINGILVTKVGISSFLVTLSMLLIVRGAALYITQGFPLKSWNQPGPLVTLLAGSFDIGSFRLYTSLWWFLALIALSAYILNYAKLGNWISAIGSNRSAAVARGVPADRVKIWLFILTSVLAGLAGMMSAFRISAASPVAGTGYELEVIAMVVVGGTALNGGRGTILGTIVGAFLLRAIRNGIVLIGVPGLAYNIFVGAIILTMLVLHALIQKTSART
jgi:simple sugar transport system permease protein